MADDVSVKFGASIEGAVKGINEIKQHLEEMKENGLSGLIEGFKGIAEVVGAAFAIEKIHEFSVEVAELGEKIERLSILTGLSTNEVQEFQFAVKMTGGDADTAAASLLRFEANLGKAQSGTGPAADAYKQMGINLKDMTGNFKPASEILDEIAEKFSKTADNATKVQYATELGSRGFVNMIPVLDKGREGLEELRKKLEETNSKMNPEQVKAAAAAAEKMKELNQSTIGLKESLVDQKSLEMFESNINKVTQALTRGILAFKAWANGPNAMQQAGVSPVFGGATGGKLPSGASWSTERPEGAFGIKDWGQQFGPSQKPSLPPLPSSKSTTKDDDSLDIAEITTEQKLAQEAFKQKQELLKQATIAHEQSKVAQLQQEQEAETQMYQIDLRAFKEKADLYDEDSDEYAKTQLQIEILSAQHATKMQQYTTKIAQANQQASQQAYRSWISALQPIETAFDGMLNGILSGTETIGQAMSNAFANMAISVIESIAKVILEWLVFEAVCAVTGQTPTWAGFVAASGGGAGGGGGGGFLGGVGKILGFETGTDYVPSTGLYQLHQGEIVVPPGLSGQIRSGGAGIGSGGGEGVTLNVYMSAIDSQSGMQFLHEQAGTLATIIKGQIRNGNPNLTGVKM